MSKKIDEDVLRKVYKMIYKFCIDKGISPSREEIKALMRFNSLGPVERYLGEMVKREWITLEDGKHRSIRLLKQHEFTDEINVSEITEIVTGFTHVEGTIAAGPPIEHLTGSSQSEPYKDIYILTVEGDSMIGDNICNGDYVFIRRQNTCENGDIIVASQLLGDSKSRSTLKHFFKDEEKKLVLLTSSIDPIKISADEWDNEWKIQGKLIKVLRTFDQVQLH